MPLNIDGYQIRDRDVRMYERTNIVRSGLICHLDASIFNTVTFGTTWPDLSGYKPNGTINNPFVSPEEAALLGFSAGNYYFKSGSMSSAELLEFQPNYYEGKPFCCVFRSAYRSTATTNKIDLSIPMAGLLVQRDALDLRAAVYWSTPITYNSIGGSGNNTADSGYSPRRVILGQSGGHGIYATNQTQCNWPTATGAIGAGWDGSTCGSFPNDLIWGTGESNTATYSNRSGTWSHWITWSGTTPPNNGTMVNGPTYNSSNGGSVVFDGTNDIITVPMSGLRPSYITQECWFNTNQDTSQVFIGSQYGTGSNNSYALWMTGLSSWRMGVNVGGSFTTRTYTGLSAQLNNWYHFVATYDGNNEVMYINGNQVDSYTRSGTITYDTSNTLLAVGNDWNGSGYDTGADIAVHGKLSIVRIYNRGLSATEIAHNYNVTKGRFGL